MKHIKRCDNIIDGWWNPSNEPNLFPTVGCSLVGFFILYKSKKEIEVWGDGVMGTPKLLNKIIKTSHLFPKWEFQFFGIRKEVNEKVQNILLQRFKIYYYRGSKYTVYLNHISKSYTKS